MYKKPNIISRLFRKSNSCRINHSGIVFIDRNVSIGRNVFIGNFSVIREGTVIKDNAVIGHLAVIERDSVIGESTVIQSQCHITAFADIGRKVFFGAGVITTNERRISKWRNGMEQDLRGPIVKDFARVGSGSILFPGITVGCNSEIGAGSIVTKDVPDYAKFFNNEVQAFETGTVDMCERLYND